jgi:organic radical activating enzyme
MIISTQLKHTFLDYPDPEKDAIIICFIGCEHNCIDCQNEELQHYNDILSIMEGGKRGSSIYRKINSVEILIELFLSIKKFYRTNNFVFEGGDPFYIENRNIMCEFLKWNAIHKEFNVCIYTGYNEGQIKSFNVFSGFEYIKCGVFDKTKYQKPIKSDDCMSFASTNQTLFNSKWEQLSHQGVVNFK